jgi:hypothetical protein
MSMSYKCPTLTHVTPNKPVIQSVGATKINLVLNFVDKASTNRKIKGKVAYIHKL